MKKVLLLLLLCCILLYGCSNTVKYKRLDLSITPLDGEAGILVEGADNVVNHSTKVMSVLTDSFATTMPVYEITPRQITDAEMSQFAEHFNVTGEFIKHASSANIRSDSGTVIVSEGKELTYYNHVNESQDPMTQSDDKIVEQAMKLFAELPLIEGEYECLGVLSTQTQQDYTRVGDDYIVGEEYIVSKRVAFRKVIDGTRVLGEEICNLYFSAKGLNTIRMELYNYTKVGEIPMLSLQDAIDKIEDSDAFSVDADETTFSGVADKLTVERVKLLYVNQYSEGCTILQPVFNLMGTAENNSGTAEFSAKIIAIPEKYTYEDD